MSEKGLEVVKSEGQDAEDEMGIILLEEMFEKVKTYIPRATKEFADYLGSEKAGNAKMIIIEKIEGATPEEDIICVLHILKKGIAKEIEFDARPVAEGGAVEEFMDLNEFLFKFVSPNK